MQEGNVYEKELEKNLSLLQKAKLWSWKLRCNEYLNSSRVSCAVRRNTHFINNSLLRMEKLNGTATCRANTLLLLLENRGKLNGAAI